MRAFSMPTILSCVAWKSSALELAQVLRRRVSHEIVDEVLAHGELSAGQRDRGDAVARDGLQLLAE
jgi:hypothetical protein